MGAEYDKRGSGDERLESVWERRIQKTLFITCCVLPIDIGYTSLTLRRFPGWIIFD